MPRREYPKRGPVATDNLYRRPLTPAGQRELDELIAAELAGRGGEAGEAEAGTAGAPVVLEHGDGSA